MKKLNILLFSSLLLAGSLVSCGNSEFTIKICASELPHARILREAVAPVLKQKGYDLKVTVLKWNIQNSAVAHDDYDANYFQHIPYLNSNNLTGEKELAPVCKVHYEKLCMYASDTSKKEIKNGSKIAIVNDVTNIERALLLLQSHNILTINASNYDGDGVFRHFSTTDPNSCVTFKEGYTNCKLTCLQESVLCASLPDYNFGVIPGNSALTGLDKLSDRIVLSEDATKEVISERSNVVAVKKANIASPKTIALVDAFSSNDVKTYIETTFGDAVLYTYEKLI